MTVKILIKHGYSFEPSDGSFNLLSFPKALLLIFQGQPCPSPWKSMSLFEHYSLRSANGSLPYVQTPHQFALLKISHPAPPPLKASPVSMWGKRRQVGKILDGGGGLSPQRNTRLAAAVAQWKSRIHSMWLAHQSGLTQQDEHIEEEKKREKN